jgi:4-amino-4-deoxy-L-arabinose transferase
MKNNRNTSEKNLLLLVLFLFIIVYLTPLGIRPMVTPDEPRYAEIAREMIASGNWISAHLNGVRYLEKPVMGFWSIACAMKLFGVNSFSARLPSALAAGLTGLLLFYLVRRETQDRYSALLAAVIFLTFGMVYVLGTFCIPDAVFTLFVAATLIFFFFSYREQHLTKKVLFLSLAGVFLGFGFLTKGLVALAIPVLVVIPFMIWERRFVDLLKTFWIPIVAAVIVALPWSILIHFENSDFWHYFVWVSHIARFTGEESSTNLHTEPFWYYLPILLGGMLPWSVLLPSVVSGTKREHLTMPLFRFSLCWLIFPLVFFSISSGKLGTYILPLMPAAALLFTIGLVSFFQTAQNRSFSYSAVFLGAALGMIALYLIVASFFNNPEISLFSGEEWPKRAAAVIGVGVWSLLLIAISRAKKLKAAALIFAAAPLCLLISSSFIFPDIIKTHKVPDDFYAEYHREIEPGSTVLGYKHSAYIASWYLQRDDILFYINPGVLEYGLAQAGDMDRLIDINELPVIVAEKSHNEPLYLFLKTKEYERYFDYLPEPVSIDSYGDFMILKF